MKYRAGRFAAGVEMLSEEQMMQNEKRYIPLEIQHLLQDGARRRGTSFEDEKYAYETSELEKLVDTSVAEDVAREAAEAAREQAIQKSIQEDEARARDEVADFVGKMCTLRYSPRSNSKKAFEFQLLFSAASTLSVQYEESDPRGHAATFLFKYLATAEEFLYESPDDEKFRAWTLYALKEFTHFGELAAEIRKGREVAAIRAIALKLAPRRQVLLDDETAALLKKRCSTRRNPKIRVPQLPPFPSDKGK